MNQLSTRGQWIEPDLRNGRDGRDEAPAPVWLDGGAQGTAPGAALGGSGMIRPDAASMGGAGARNSIRPMNTPPPSSTPAASARELVTVRPPRFQTVLRILTAIGAVVSVLLGLAAYEDMLPASVAVWAAGATAILAALKQLIEAVGDVLDDGVRNHSFKVGLIATALLPLLLCHCSTRADGTRTFLGLDAGGWRGVGKAAGQGAVSAALPAYKAERAQTLSK